MQPTANSHQTIELYGITLTQPAPTCAICGAPLDGDHVTSLSTAVSYCYPCFYARLSTYEQRADAGKE